MNKQARPVVYFSLLLPLLTGCGSLEREPELGASLPDPRRSEAPKQAAKPEPNHLDLAKGLVGKGYYDVALAQLEEAVKKHPKDAEIHHFMAVCHRELGDNARAKALFEKALAMDPRLAAAWDGLGITYDLMGDGKEARVCFDKAIRLNPARAEFRNNLGFSLLRQGRLAEAKRAFERGLALDSGYRTAMNNLAICHLMEGDEGNALALLRKSGSLTAAYYNMGVVHQMKGNTQRAAVFFKKALERDPRMKLAAEGLASLGKRTRGDT